MYKLSFSLSNRSQLPQGNICRQPIVIFSALNEPWGTNHRSPAMMAGGGGGAGSFPTQWVLSISASHEILKDQYMAAILDSRLRNIGLFNVL